MPMKWEFVCARRMYFGSSGNRAVLNLVVCPIRGDLDQSSSSCGDMMLSGREGTTTGVARMLVMRGLSLKQNPPVIEDEHAAREDPMKMR
jgi:hypothetical protein